MNVCPSCNSRVVGKQPHEILIASCKTLDEITLLLASLALRHRKRLGSCTTDAAVDFSECLPSQEDWPDEGRHGQAVSRLFRAREGGPTGLMPHVQLSQRSHLNMVMRMFSIT